MKGHVVYMRNISKTVSCIYTKPRKPNRENQDIIKKE
jgi:hypothetical protein